MAAWYLVNRITGAIVAGPFVNGPTALEYQAQSTYAQNPVLADAKLLYGNVQNGTFAPQ